MWLADDPVSISRKCAPSLCMISRELVLPTKRGLQTFGRSGMYGPLRVARSYVTLHFRMVLNYKGIPHKTEWVEFPDVESCARGLELLQEVLILTVPYSILYPSCTTNAPTRASQTQCLSRATLTQPTLILLQSSPLAPSLSKLRLTLRSNKLSWPISFRFWLSCISTS